jgi:formate-dependent nitrite reductase cytochrome c552 subunit
MKSPINVFVAMLRSGRRVVDKFLPPRHWMVPVILTAGVFCGLGVAILHISNATSYLSEDPRACLNCHIMAPQFATWQRGSHARVGLAEDSITKAHIEAKAAWDAGATESEMKLALQLIRQAQWRWDWVAAHNGMGFHSPQECARVLGTSIDKAGLARLQINRILMAHGVMDPVPIPDLSTKEKAQAYIGLDMAKLTQEKEEFLRTVIPQWDKEAAERQAAMNKTPPKQQSE